MPATGTVRCAHCFASLPESETIAADGDALCATCAHLAGVASSSAPIPAGRPNREKPDDSHEIARRVCEEAGVPLTVPDDAPPTLGERIAARGLPLAILDDAREWCRGRWGILRAPALLFFAYVWARHAGDPMYQSVFKGLNLGIHELGHYVFGFGDIVAALGGSLLQCLAPMIAMVMFARQRDYFAISFAFGWLATNYFELATYVGDAVDRSLPLVTPGGGEPIHDWNYILGNYGWLRHTDTLAGLHAFAGHACMVICLGTGAWIVATMIRSPAANVRSVPITRG
jgi:hypothetical protein